MRPLFMRLYSCFVLILGCSYAIVLTLLFFWAVLLPPRPRYWFYDTIQRLLLQPVMRLFLPMPIRYSEQHVAQSTLPKPYAIISNHLSLLDIIVYMLLFPAGFLMKSGLRFSPIGVGAALLGGIAVDRNDHQSSRRAIHRFIERLREGKVLIVFPEGTRSRSGELLPFQRGLLAKLYYEKIPVLAIGIWGTQHCLPAKAQFLQGFFPVAVTTGALLQSDDYPNAKAFAQACYEAVQSATEQSKIKLNS